MIPSFKTPHESCRSPSPHIKIPVHLMNATYCERCQQAGHLPHKCPTVSRKRSMMPNSTNDYSLTPLANSQTSSSRGRAPSEELPFHNQGQGPYLLGQKLHPTHPLHQSTVLPDLYYAVKSNMLIDNDFPSVSCLPPLYKCLLNSPLPIRSTDGTYSAPSALHHPHLNKLAKNHAACENSQSTASHVISEEEIHSYFEDATWGDIYEQLWNETTGSRL